MEINRGEKKHEPGFITVKLRPVKNQSTDSRVENSRDSEESDSVGWIRIQTA